MPTTTSIRLARRPGICSQPRRKRSVVVHGHAANEIIRFAEAEGANLIVMGRQGHSRVTRFFLGSTTDRVSEHCHCTVMIVK